MARRRGVDPSVGGFQELVVGVSGLDPSIDADLEKLADLIISRQGGDVGLACCSASAALAALLAEQAASPVRLCVGPSRMPRWLSTMRPTLVFVEATSR